VTNTVTLGELTCPSGRLVLMDGGYLRLWSGRRTPENPDREYIDLEVTGPDAARAAASFNRQSGRTLYDIPADRIGEFAATFDAHCREHRLNASLRRFAEQVPHRERVRRAVDGHDPDFLITGLSVVAVGGLPTGRRGDHGHRFAWDFRPHSHHCAATVMFAMTSVGDGFFPAHLDIDAAGDPVAIRIVIDYNRGR
jgi:hypothetical protein